MTFFQTFFAEKDLTEMTYEVESPDGTPNLIPTSVVIERIMNTRGEEAKNIESILRTIDLANGDVHHFLKYLAGAIAEDLAFWVLQQYATGELISLLFSFLLYYN